MLPEFIILSSQKPVLLKSPTLMTIGKLTASDFFQAIVIPKTPGVEIASGSLGQGLSVAHGIALRNSSCKALTPKLMSF